MKILRIEQFDYAVPFLHPFQTSYGCTTEKQASIYVLHDESGVRGVGELDALPHPDYIEEYLSTARATIATYLIPLLLKKEWHRPEEIGAFFAGIQGNFMAKAALETAAWDCFSRVQKQPLYQILGGTKRPIHVGISFGIESSISTLIKKVQTAIDQGYTRVKLKIKPGYDYGPLSAIREAFPSLSLMADANSAYQREEDWTIFRQLDTLQLAMIEQPFGTREFTRHAALQRQMHTPICLDETIRSVEDVQTAAALGSCRAINLKLPRVGGITAAQAILQEATQQGMLVWLGGMYELGVGRALNLHFSSLAELTFPGDLSATNRYFAADIVTPEAQMVQGALMIPDSIGIGVTIHHDKFQTNYRLFT